MYPSSKESRAALDICCYQDGGRSKRKITYVDTCVGFQALLRRRA